MNNRCLLTVKEYSEKYKITKQAIYSKVKRGVLKSEIHNNITYIIDLQSTPVVQHPVNSVDSSQTIEKIMLENIILKQTIERLLTDKEILNKRLDNAEFEKKELIERNREQNHLIMQSQKNFETLQINYNDEKSKTWLQKLFKK